ncbi:MAG TPA: FecR family protein [Bradyrhizobium sp.]|nr:FecR family protein [Bradyrhizobium sp.]
MCTIRGIALAAGLVLALTGLSAVPCEAQVGPSRPAIANSPTKPIGKVIAATGAVSIERASAVVVQASTAGQADQTKVGDLVYQGDVVKTGADGRIGINFADGSSFNLSSNARMALDEFVYDPNGKSNSTFFNLTSGTMTFVAGGIAKSGDMKVDTPVATMGIRGTTPHVEISNDGAVKFSTLIEEGKGKLAKKLAPSTAQRPEQADKFRPNICRGC